MVRKGGTCAARAAGTILHLRAANTIAAAIDGTEVEPTTSSLGIKTCVESKSLARFCCELLNLQRLAESAFSRFVIPIETQNDTSAARLSCQKWFGRGSPSQPCPPQCRRSSARASSSMVRAFFTSSPLAWSSLVNLLTASV